MTNPPLTRPQLDSLAYAAGEVVIAQAKKDYYAGLFRKWWVSWTTVSRWTKAVGERQGAPGAALGAAAVAAFDAEMGDAAQA